jgi:hypothetical protein
MQFFHPSSFWRSNIFFGQIVLKYPPAMLHTNTQASVLFTFTEKEFLSSQNWDIHFWSSNNFQDTYHSS